MEYLKFIRDIRDDQPELFQKIKLLPKKARSARDNDAENDRLLTFFRKGKLKKFFISGGKSSRELTFFEAVDIFKCEPDTARRKIPKQYYTMLDRNKARFDLITSGDVMGAGKSGGRGGLSNERYVIMRLKATEFRKYQGFTDDDEEYIKLVLKGYEYGVIPKNTTKGIKKKIEKEINPLKVLAILKITIPYNILSVERPNQPIISSKREIVLSEYLTGEQKNK